MDSWREWTQQLRVFLEAAESVFCVRIEAADSVFWKQLRVCCISYCPKQTCVRKTRVHHLISFHLQPTGKDTLCSFSSDNVALA